MRIAIVQSDSEKLYTRGVMRALSDRGIEFHAVDIQAPDAIARIKQFDALIWHFSHAAAFDYLAAKAIIQSLEISGFTVFPPVRDIWHFDDKLAQKYLFDALEIPSPVTEVYFDADSALDRLSRSSGPIVMKLRGGAASANVKLISNDPRGRRLVRKAFGGGFRQFDRWELAKDAWGRARSLGPEAIVDACRETAKIFVRSTYEKVRGPERGYVIMQQFLPGNSHDVRLVVMDGKAFGLRRFNREGDFRASGSGAFDFDPGQIPFSCVEVALATAKRLEAVAIAFDFLFDNGAPKIVEISYGINSPAYRHCVGFWDGDGRWVPSPWPPGEFHFENFIVDAVIAQVEQKTADG